MDTVAPIPTITERLLTGSKWQELFVGVEIMDIGSVRTITSRKPIALDNESARELVDKGVFSPAQFGGSRWQR